MLLHQTLSPRAEVAVQDLENGAVLVNMATGKCWELNLLGAEIWRHIGCGLSLEAIRDVLCAKYNVSTEIIVRDLLAIATELQEQQLVEVSV